MSGRNVLLTTIAGRLRAQGHDEDGILSHLLSCPEREDLSERECRTIARSIGNRPTDGALAIDLSSFDSPVERLAAVRGWTVDSLNSLGAVPGKGRASGEVQFPMRDATGAIVGWRRRRGDGTAFCNGAKALARRGDKAGAIVGPFPIPDDVALILLVEGEADAAAALSAGVLAVIATPSATPGAATWEAVQRLCHGHHTVILFPDPGEAGGKWLSLAANRLRAVGCEVRHVPAGELDLDKRLRRSTDRRAELARLIESAVPVLDSQLGETEDTRPPSQDVAASKLVELHGADLRWVDKWGRWLVWDGSRWREDETRAAKRLATEACRIVAAGDPRGGKAMLSAAAIEGTERLARNAEIVAATVAEWDQRDFLMATPGGTVDLRTGALRPANRDDRLTRSTSVAPSDSDDCPRWKRFLARTFDHNSDLIAYVQRFVGYSLTGSCREHVMVFGHGSGRNGKSTLTNILSHLWGDHAVTANASLLEQSQFTEHATEIARLRGPRLAIAHETEAGRPWAESRLKSLTGGDVVSARFMRCDFFSFVPKFKLLICGNHRPQIRGTDEGLRRRLHLLPFTTTIPRDEVDHALGEKLIAEGPGILRWAIIGALEWQRIGLAPPEVVTAATAEYFASEDVVGRWLADRCAIGKEAANGWTPSGGLWKDFQRWCESNGEFAGSQRRLSDELAKLGMQNTRGRMDDGKRVWGFAGVVIRSHSRLARLCPEERDCVPPHVASNPSRALGFVNGWDTLDRLDTDLQDNEQNRMQNICHSVNADREINSATVSHPSTVSRNSPHQRLRSFASGLAWLNLIPADDGTSQSNPEFDRWNTLAADLGLTSAEASAMLARANDLVRPTARARLGDPPPPEIVALIREVHPDYTPEGYTAHA